jgi:hypothetical protein
VEIHFFYCNQLVTIPLAACKVAPWDEARNWSLVRFGVSECSLNTTHARLDAAFEVASATDATHKIILRLGFFF